MKKRSLLVLSFALALTGFTAQAGAQANSSSWCKAAKPVRFAQIGWESGQFTTEVMRYILEKGYGCKTDTTNGATNITENALATGDLEVWAEEWKGFNEVTNKAIKDGKAVLVGNTLTGGTVEGWFVPTYVVKGPKAVAPGLKSVSDLPKYKQLFLDDEDPTKGRLLGCVPGWVCEKTNDGKLKAYKLDKDFTQFRPGSQAALDSSVISAVKQNKPILFYYWGPTSLLGKYSFTQLKEPAYNAKCYELEKANDPKACPSASVSTMLQVNLNKAFSTSDPVLTKFFSKVNMSNQQLSKALIRIVDEKAKPTDVALEFLKANPTTWTKWVPASVAAKVQASLK